MKYYLINKVNEINIEVLKQYINDLNFKVHLKLPAWSVDSVRFLLKEFSSSERKSLVLHSYYELALELGLSGIHINSWYKEFDNVLLNKIRTSNLSISKSCHSLQELQDGESFDYLVFSPVFSSISKENYHPKVSESKLTETLKKVPTPVVALGGVTPNNYSILFELGFKGAMLSGFVWDTKNLKEVA